MRILLFLSILPSLLSAQVRIPEKEQFQLFLLAGQSNMSGRGKPDDAPKTSIPHIFAMNKKPEWQAATDPLHWDKTSAGVGIGKTFAAMIAKEKTADSIGLIPAAAGGSPISTWVPGGYHDQTKSHPYDDAIKLAMEKGTLKAILFHQGESDSNKSSARGYGKRLEALIKRFAPILANRSFLSSSASSVCFPERRWQAKKSL